MACLRLKKRWYTTLVFVFLGRKTDILFCYGNICANTNTQNESRAKRTDRNCRMLSGRKFSFLGINDEEVIRADPVHDCNGSCSLLTELILIKPTSNISSPLQVFRDGRTILSGIFNPISIRFNCSLLLKRNKFGISISLKLSIVLFLFTRRARNRTISRSIR